MNNDTEFQLLNVTGNQTLNVPEGLRIHQITISNAIGAGSSGTATVKLKMQGSPTFIPLIEEGVTKTFTFDAADTETGQLALTQAMSIEAIKIVSSSGTYSVGYAAFDVEPTA